MPRYRARYFGEIPGKQKHSVVRISEGQEFDYDGPPGKWMQPIEEYEAEIAENESDEPPAKAPTTLSEISASVQKQQDDALAKLNGEPPKRGPGRPRKELTT
jgi:hypothetical protein